MSVDSENQKILQEFMDVLDNQEEEQMAKNGPPKHQPPPQQPPQQYQQMLSPFGNPSPKPQQNHNMVNVQHNQYPSQKEYSPQPVQSKPIFKTTNQLPGNLTTSHKPKNHSTSNIELQAPKTEQKFSTLSMGKNMSQTKEQGEGWRSSADLQDRVKKAIEKSQDVIKKFKSIKDNGSS